MGIVGLHAGSLLAALLAAVLAAGCAGLQPRGAGKTTGTPAQSSGTRAKPPGAMPADATPKAVPTASASGAYSVTFGISARTSRLGAVQFDARAKSGGWQGAGAGVACRNVSGAAMMACNNKGGGLLSCALIDPKGISTPEDLVICRVRASKAVGAGDFSVKVTDASGPDMRPVGVSVVVMRVAAD